VDLGRGQFRRAASATDEELVRIIRTGIPNTGMPPNNISEINAGNIVAYLRTIATETRSTSAPGDAGRGKAIQVRSQAHRPAVAAEAVATLLVGEEHEHVGPFARAGFRPRLRLRERRG
jgi:hypothetical protein